ncbi:MAG: OmpH family outer membrane protein [Saccharospirillaceae bacterium]|nr:OmpH family outer membrane protein [Pseudomonadales bacterium]NRB78605.1 OmpH family outer membrane protein [Saccharospirillaceae bacterium]
MKQLKILITIALISMFGSVYAADILDAKQSTALNQLKIGFMNQDILFEQSAIAKLYKPRMDAQARQVDAKIAELVAQFQKLEQDYKSEQGIATDEELQTMQQAMQQKEYEVQNLQQQLQQMLANFGQSFSQQFGSVFRSALELVVQDKQLDLVFDATSLLYVNNELNISHDVLAKFDELTATSYLKIKAQFESQTVK